MDMYDCQALTRLRRCLLHLLTNALFPVVKTFQLIINALSLGRQVAADILLVGLGPNNGSLGPGDGSLGRST